MKAVIYCRVSRKDQDYHRQISDLQSVAKKHGWEVIEIVTEKISGARTKRSGVEKIMQLAENKAFDKLMVSEISRLGRSTLQVLHIIERLTELGISVYIGNYGVETIQPDGKRNPMISMLVSILTEFSVMERESLIERTKSGLAQAKRNGTKLGRPFGSKKSREQLLAENPKVVKLLKSNRSIREIAKLADRSVNTVIKVKRVMGR
jgi:DNA invertase Pin-like site-specific DNA recombinase